MGTHTSNQYDKVQWLLTREHLWKDAKLCAGEMLRDGLYAKGMRVDDIYHTMWKWWELARQVKTGEITLESLRANRRMSLD